MQGFKTRGTSNAVKPQLDARVGKKLISGTTSPPIGGARQNQPLKCDPKPSDAAFIFDRRPEVDDGIISGMVED